MNYFELYGLKEQFLLDDQQVKKIYLTLSKKYHPDFYSGADAAKQAEILELSTLNNKAFQVLGNFDKRMKYILQLHQYLEEEEKYTLPQMFLMEMMDLNELAMEVQFDPDPDKLEELLKHIEAAEGNLLQSILPVLDRYDAASATPEDFHQIKEFYYKHRYLLRLREQLDKLN